MEVKGNAVLPFQTFVKDKFGSRYDEWFNSLSKASSDIIKGATSLGWYPLNEAITEPTQKICDLFYGGKETGALEIGKYSAEHALKGVYKVFIKLGSPQFIISKASDILPSYYKGSAMKVVEVTKNGAVAQLSNFPDLNRFVELRIIGFVERALEISGCKNVKVVITKSITKGDAVSEFSASWD